MRGLAEKVFVVTGGAGGIGAATALRLSEEGSHLAIVDRDGQKAREVAESLPGDAIGIEADVSDERSVADYHAMTLTTFGRIDGVHLNAGIEGEWGRSFMETEMDDFDRVMAVNLRGVYLGMRQALRDLRSQGDGGSIVTTASVVGLIGSGWVSPYVGAKHGVVGLTKAGAVNGGPLGVRVNCVAPGMILTALTDFNESQADDAAAARSAQIATVPLGRAGLPMDVAALVAFLLSDDSSYINGSVIPIDGGSLIDHPRTRLLQAQSDDRPDEP